MKINGYRIKKRETEKRIKTATPPGWTFIRVNWKNGIAHFADTHKRKVLVPISLEGRA